MLLYLVTASGFALNLHYCGKLVTSVRFDTPAEKCFPEAMKCCRDKHIEVKVKDAHQAYTATDLAKVFAVDVPRSFYQYRPLSAQIIPLNVSSNRGPPEPPGVAIHLKNCTFRI